MRKLASIQRITNLEPIQGKDKIELASVLGWKVIVQKGQFKIGDMCVYCEVDSLLPERPEFEFLRKNCYSKKYGGFRIRVMRMGGVYSEGICFHPSAFHFATIEEGLDVTNLLEIKKYDPESALERQITERKQSWIVKLLKRIPFLRRFFLRKGGRDNFPSFLIPKTDETRVQVLQETLDKYKGAPCYITEKLDGQSATYLWWKNQFYVCSRNFRVTDKNTTYWRIEKKYDISGRLKKFGKNFAIQGEIMGSGVQGNKYKLQELDFYVFNVWDIKTKSLLDQDEFPRWLGLKTVPKLIHYYELESDMEKLVELARNKSRLADIPREGIVIRGINGLPHDVTGINFSFKVINPDFSIKYGSED